MPARHAIVDSPVGPLTIAADGEAIVGIWFEQHRYPTTAATLGARVSAADDPVLAKAAEQLLAYLRGERDDFDLPVRTSGSPLQELVWARLRRIPRGTTVTYGEIAREIGDGAIAQAVGQAVGHNPISIVIPCHRVVGADGSLTGFAGGLDRKRRLLELEGAVAPALF
ncbi:methylated-DNA--[protein]-cysteine S-methyltransferase [Calidifontibacter sp. DB0510]|uniref:Methylated-DNA--protein-cysteine methyltransferase n=1 Tax=Metallococcus carri TaxID=1656884 RepID=A0A967AYD3_9MICO|nr:methylated-DNA--[protein]-cysteine S-methyltransferase [Metallococcus carri]NHN54699.1 methylated-DNA--[protein]-cysteine S-methyltransferase [Metallococcus carri]NOP37044.1 methylated-DNA--[protein]-cysteine S-methyltransferase [Calidifontibacter sp. DB2511S]